MYRSKQRIYNNGFRREGGALMVYKRRETTMKPISFFQKPRYCVRASNSQPIESGWTDPKNSRFDEKYYTKEGKSIRNL